MGEAIVALNAGSSSIKFAAYEVQGDDLDVVSSGQIERIGTSPHLVAHDRRGTVIADLRWDGDIGHERAIDQLGQWLQSHLGDSTTIGVGHRVVHGGATLSRPVLIDIEVLRALESLVSLAPLHQPYNLAVIKAVARLRPDTPQVACFDTAFHRGHPEVADRFGLPDALFREGLRRYGFHGLSYEYISRMLRQVAPDVAGGRVVVAHLGSGASMCAIRGGRSMASTMGLTALDGLPMGTRCGSVDPGVLLHLLRGGMSVDDLETLLYRQSGLLGVSGVCSDLRTLLESGESGAAAAIDYFVYRIGRELGSLVMAIGGLDALVFTGGIGENAPQIRARVCEQAAWLGVELDAEANQRGDACISPPASRPSVWVLPTDEERMIALHTLALVRSQAVTFCG